MSSLSQAFKDDPLHLKSIVPLDFTTLINTIPESHEWPHESSNEDEYEKSKMIPVIDLTHPEASQLVTQATKAWGMFQVINHGVPLDLLQNVEEEARRLFNLPSHDKLKVLRSPDCSTGYGVARIAPFAHKSMWHEGFTIIGGSCVDHAKKLWSQDYHKFCDTMEECQKKMKSLANCLLLQLLESLHISQETKNILADDESEGALQLNSYPPCPDPSRVMGLAPHTDTLLLTILNQCQIPGLQIFRDDMGWIGVPPVSGALVVNVGDILHILSNGKFPSAYHRVVVSENKHRISFAYFRGPKTESQVEPLNKLEMPMYRSLSVKEFIGIKAKYNEKAVSLVKL